MNDVFMPNNLLCVNFKEISKYYVHQYKLHVFSCHHSKKHYSIMSQ